VDPRQWKLQKERLHSEFTKALDTFQRAQRAAAQKEKDVVRKAKSHSGGLPPPGSDTLIDIEEGRGEYKTQAMLEEEYNVEQLQEREKAIRQLEADIGDVNEIFKDLATMVHEQGEMVDSIEANVETTAISVGEGAEQLRQAERYQSRSRRRILYLASFSAAVVFLLVLIVWLSS